MIIRINGNIKPYYVQTLAMIFFPGVRFPDNEEEMADTLVAELDLLQREDGISAHVLLKRGEHLQVAEAFVSREGFYTDEERQIKLAAGEAFMKAGVAFTGFTPPWGILTGVRPAKVASELLEKGISPEECAEIIRREYFVDPVKAKLATDVALTESKLITPQKRRECSVYIGIPFCPTRCAYCSFVSYTSPGLLKLVPQYLDRLMGDVDGIFHLIKELGMKVSSVYIGGGTPTILTAEQLKRLLSGVNGHVKDLEEFTLEAGRPDTITEEKLRVAVACGVDRISVNPQTLNDEVLEKIGRAHNTEMFFSAYETAKKSGIRHINVDLIAGLPYDTAESFRHTLDTVIGLDPSNITVHTFSVKKSSAFRTEGKYDPQSWLAAESVAYSQKALGEAGYLPYYMYRQKNTVGNLENVGYAMPGCEGLYNIYMMEEVQSIFAAGASSVSKLVSLPDGEGNVRIERLFQPKYPYEYLGEDGADRLAALRKAAMSFSYE